MDNEPSEVTYLINCLQCDDQSRPLAIPFESAEARGKWAAEHRVGTGHYRWHVRDKPRCNKQPADTMTNNEVTVDKLRAAVIAHESHGSGSWYADEYVIDCDASEFWAVIAAVLQKG